MTEPQRCSLWLGQAVTDPALSFRAIRVIGLRILAFGIAALGIMALAVPAHAAEPDLDALRARLSGSGQTTSLLFLTQAERRVAFAHIDHVLTTRPVPASATPRTLVDAHLDLRGVTYQVDDTTYSVADFLEQPAAIGLIVAQGDQVLLEHYAPGHTRESRWISFSVTKSVTSLLIGAAIQDGFIDNVDEPVTNYLPRLRGTPYETATIRHVLNMASGVAWNEDYASPDSDVARAGAANGLTLVRYLGGLPRVAAPGAVFNYNTGETNLAGEILRAAIGNNAATYLIHRIWQPFGMEHDANWLTSGADGGETGGCCISATLRDYLRLGQFALTGGVLADGTRVLPPDWMTQSTKPSPGAAGYGYLWWLSPDGAYAARGIFGQQIFIDPDSRIVIAAHSNAATATGDAYHKHLDAVTAALRAAVIARRSSDDGDRG